MPLYEYLCESCRHRFERIQKFSDPPVDVCPNCSKGPIKKLLSSPAIQFKGTGWYVTDYASKSGTDAGKRASDKEASSAPPAASGDSGTKAESKGDGDKKSGGDKT